MVKLMGHLAMGLLFAIPAWFVWSRRASLVFVVLAFLAAPLPDVDLYIEAVTPSLIHHHGFTHTIVFVVALGIVLGGLVALFLADPIDRWLQSERFDRTNLFVFASSAFTVGGLSHVFADMLSAPDIATPIEPLWPLVQGSWGFDLIWYSNFWWNVGLLALALAIHVGLAIASEPVEHPYRLADQ